MRSPGSEVKVQQHEHLNWGFSQQHSLFFDNGREGKHPRVASIYFLDILFFFWFGEYVICFSKKSHDSTAVNCRRTPARWLWWPTPGLRSWWQPRELCDAQPKSARPLAFLQLNKVILKTNPAPHQCGKGVAKEVLTPSYAQ